MACQARRYQFFDVALRNCLLQVPATVLSTPRERPWEAPPNLPRSFRLRDHAKKRPRPSEAFVVDRRGEGATRNQPTYLLNTLRRSRVPCTSAHYWPAKTPCREAGLRGSWSCFAGSSPLRLACASSCACCICLCCRSFWFLRSGWRPCSL